jgi:signal transduction histidine kinase
MKAAPAPGPFDAHEALEQIRRSWLSNFSHGLSGPLFTTRGYLRLVLRAPDSGLSENHRKYLSTALENIDQLMALARDLNDFPVGAGADLGPFSFRDALQAALSQTLDRFAAKRLRSVAEAPDDPLITVNARQAVIEALRGLLAAAMQSASEGGLLEVSAAEENEQLVLRLSAGPTKNNELLPDMSAASKLWRAQGGSISVCISEGRFLLTGELPVIRMAEC